MFLVTGGYAENPGRFLDSTEMLIEGQKSWVKVDSLSLPSERRGPAMITLENTVFVTGRSRPKTFV